MRDTVSMSSCRTLLMSPRMMPEKPSRMPNTGMPSTQARMVAAPITLLMPGAGPPPTRIASLLSVMDPQPRRCEGARQALVRARARLHVLVLVLSFTSRAELHSERRGLEQVPAVFARLEEVHS